MTELPTGWTRLALSELCLPVKKMEPKSTERPSVRYVDIGSVDGEHHSLSEVALVDSASAPTRCRQLLMHGDTVFATVRPYLEKIAFIDSRFENEFASTGFCILRPDPTVLLPRYLFHFAVSRQMLDQVLVHQRGVSYPAVLDKNVKATAIPVPPLVEQSRIVDILEDHLSRLDAAESALTRSRVRLKRFQQASDVACLSAAAEAASTTQTTVGALARVGTGATPLKSRTDYYVGGSIPWVTSADLAQGFIERANHFVTDLALKETAIKLWPVGTILVAMYGEGKTRGTVAELGIAATTNQACAAIELHDSDPSLKSWIRLVLDSSYWSMRRMASGGVQPNLNLGLVRSIEVPVPVPDTRARLLRAREAHLHAQQMLATELALSEIRARSLRRSLLAAAFAGRLTGRSTDMELVEEMAGV